jgi:hypothetical protein
MPVGAWITFEERTDGSREIRTSDIDGVIKVLSLDVVAAFCACFVHADRLQSLFTMYEVLVGVPQRLATDPSKRRPPTISESRDFLTFYAMAYGTLVELADELRYLNSALASRGLFLPDKWEPLKSWVRWASKAAPAMWRNKFAFHIDREWVKEGLSKIRRRSRRRTVKPTFFMLGTSAKLRDIHFKLGHDAMLAGVPREFGVSDFHRMLGVYNPLEKFFRETIEHAGLGPIKIGVRRGR